MGKDALGFSAKDYKILKLKQQVNNFVEKYCLLPVYTKDFGLRRARNLHKLRNNRMEWLDKCFSYLMEDFSYLIDEYKNEDCVQSDDGSNATAQKYIWVCWLQGEENMPEMVKICISSIRKNAPRESKVVLITAKNLYNYIEVPDFIKVKIKKGTLSLTHFSDIIRFSLLSRYGGLWMDATVYVSSKIPHKYFEMPLYSIQNLSKEERHENEYYGGVTSFLVGGHQDSMLFRFCLDLFFEYQKKYDRLIDVHLINLCYAMAYRNFSSVKESVDKIEINNRNVQELNQKANDTFNLTIWDDLVSSQQFHKMNWRKQYLVKNGDSETFYGYLKRGQ